MFERFREINYYRCSNCRALFMDPAMHLLPEAEKSRYDQHNNDVNDPGYRQFVKPLVDAVMHQYGPDAIGLDYGAGPGPVAAVILKESGYHLELFDPFYCFEPQLLDKIYDYIICCEVIEHFHDPAVEFKKLKSILKDRGSLYCRTEIYKDSIDFQRWYYKNDPTHTFFYHRKTLEWIRAEFNFKVLKIRNNIIHFCS